MLVVGQELWVELRYGAWGLGCSKKQGNAGAKKVGLELAEGPELERRQKQGLELGMEFERRQDKGLELKHKRLTDSRGVICEKITTF